MNDVYVAEESWKIEAQRKELAFYLLTYSKKTEALQRLHLYVDYLCHLLNGRSHHIELPQPKAADAFIYGGRPSGEDCDLIVFGEPDRSLVKRLLLRYNKPHIVGQIATSILVTRKPRHPIRNVLLILRADGSDETAVSWACRLVNQGDIQLTCLPLVPAQSGLNRFSKPTDLQETTAWVEGTSTAAYLHRLERKLERANIPYRLTLQGGEPANQIEKALAAGDHDLIIVAAEPDERTQRFFLGEVVPPLLHKLDRPLLIAKSTLKP